MLRRITGAEGAISGFGLPQFPRNLRDLTDRLYDARGRLVPMRDASGRAPGSTHDVLAAKLRKHPSFDGWSDYRMGSNTVYGYRFKVTGGVVLLMVPIEPTISPALYGTEGVKMPQLIDVVQWAVNALDAA